MIEARLGFNMEAAKAMYEAYRDAPGEKFDESVDAFCDRAMAFGAFIGFYDPKPVGAMIFDGPYLHIGLLPEARRKCGPAFTHWMKWAQKRIPIIIARVHPDNGYTRNCVLRLGFKRAERDDADGFQIYVRQ